MKIFLNHTKISFQKAHSNIALDPAQNTDLIQGFMKKGQMAIPKGDTVAIKGLWRAPGLPWDLHSLLILTPWHTQKKDL